MFCKRKKDLQHLNFHIEKHDIDKELHAKIFQENFLDLLLLMYGTGLPNPNFRNQEFSVKNQESIRRFFSKNQETCSRNQKENRRVSRSFF